METKKYYIDLLESRIVDFNPYLEAPMEKTLLREKTEEAVDMLKSYFSMIKEFEKILKPTNYDYNEYPDSVKQIIKSIIDIISDGRDLWNPIDWNGRTYDHHINENGHLGFENNPFQEVKWCEDFLDNLTEIINSEKNTANLSKYIDRKWRLFQGYESGAWSVRFSKINKNKNGKYTFDGDMICWATPDSEYEGDGIIINADCSDISFNELPYCDGEFESDKDLEEFIESAEEVETDEEIKKNVHEVMDNILSNCLGIE